MFHPEKYKRIVSDKCVMVTEQWSLKKFEKNKHESKENVMCISLDSWMPLKWQCVGVFIEGFTGCQKKQLAISWL